MDNSMDMQATLLAVALAKKNGGGGGTDGVTFTPAVSSAGVISWTNDGNKENPEPVDLAAAVIAALPSAVGVTF